MPVVTPSRASIEVVKAVSCRDWLLEAISGRPSWSIRSPCMARQISPRPWIAMKFTASGVAIWAGITRSPSFSRSSWSTRMNMRPLRASSMMSSTEEMASVKSVSAMSPSSPPEISLRPDLWRPGPEFQRLGAGGGPGTVCPRRGSGRERRAPRTARRRRRGAFRG